MKLATLKRVVLATTGFLTVFCSAPLGAARAPEHQAREAAKKAVRTYAERNTFFSAHRREDLEDVFHSVTPITDGALNQDPKIFELSDEGYEFGSDRVEFHSSVHGPVTYLVAVGARSGETFRISGFRDSQTEFNRLAQTYHVSVGTQLQAQDYADLYFRVDPMHYRIFKTASLLLLKQLAERKYYESSDTFSAAEAQFAQWWDKNSNSLSQLTFRDDIATTDGGFTIDFLTLSGIDKKSPIPGPTPLVVRLTISKNGEVDEPRFTQTNIWKPGKPVAVEE